MDHICEDVVRLRRQTTVFFWEKNREFSCFVQPGLPRFDRRHVCFLVFGRLGQQLVGGERKPRFMTSKALC
jgi:hypothetical protein